MNLEPNSQKLTVYRLGMRFKMKNHLEPQTQNQVKIYHVYAEKQRFKMNKGEI